MLLSETLSMHNRDEFEFHVIYFLSWKTAMVSAIEKSGVPVKCFSARNNILILLQVFKLKRYCIDNKISLIHCHLPWAGFVGRFLFKITGIPVVYTEHNLQERYHWITRFLNKLTFNWQTAVIAVSKDVEQSIRKSIHPKAEVITILNGVNTQKFVRDQAAGDALKQTLNIPTDSKVIGTIAVFRFQKRLAEWLSLAAAVHKKHHEVYFLMVGTGLLEEELKSEAKKLGISDRVIMPGSQADVIPWVSLIDIYLMTSKFEGLPIALLEAMSMKCAIVTTDAGGIKEVVRHGQDGLMSATDEWKTLEGHLENLLENPDKRKALSFAARQRIEEAFSLSVMIKAVEGLYLRVIESRRD